MLSVLIVNWNTRDLLRKCLASIDRFSPSDPFEVIVVDNASTDGSADMVASEFPDVRLVAHPKNSGYAQGNNLAFAEAAGEFLLTLNPDTEFLDDSLQKAIDVLRAHPEYGALGAKQIGVDGKVQRSVRGFPSVLGIFGDITGLGRRRPGSALDSYRLSGFNYEEEGPAPQPMGTFILFRRDALAAVGDPKAPFDTDFPIFFNEVDLLHRLTAAGYPCLYSPKVKLLHYGGESTKQVRKSMIWESHRSLVRFLRKSRRGIWNAIWLAPLAVAIYGAAFIRARGYDAGFRA